MNEPNTEMVIDPHKYEVSTQTEIYVPKPLRQKIIIPDKYLKETKDSRCGPDEPSIRGFHGYSDITTDVMMCQLAGVTLTFFYIIKSP